MAEKDSNSGQPDSNDSALHQYSTLSQCTNLQNALITFRRHGDEHLFSTSFFNQGRNIIPSSAPQARNRELLRNCLLSPSHTANVPWNPNDASAFLSSHRAKAVVPELGVSTLHGQKPPLHAVTWQMVFDSDCVVWLSDIYLFSWWLLRQVYYLFTGIISRKTCISLVTYLEMHNKFIQGWDINP